MISVAMKFMVRGVLAFDPQEPTTNFQFQHMDLGCRQGTYLCATLLLRAPTAVYGDRWCFVCLSSVGGARVHGRRAKRGASQMRVCARDVFKAGLRYFNSVELEVDDVFQPLFFLVHI